MYKDDKSYYEYLTNMGLVPEDIRNDIIGPDEIAHMLEIHVEQSSHLESEKAQIGIFSLSDTSLMHSLLISFRSFFQPDSLQIDMTTVHFFN